MVSPCPVFTLTARRRLSFALSTTDATLAFDFRVHAFKGLCLPIHGRACTNRDIFEVLAAVRHLGLPCATVRSIGRSAAVFTGFGNSIAFLDSGFCGLRVAWSNARHSHVCCAKNCTDQSAVCCDFLAHKFTFLFLGRTECATGTRIAQKRAPGPISTGEYFDNRWLWWRSSRPYSTGTAGLFGLPSL